MSRGSPGYFYRPHSSIRECARRLRQSGARARKLKDEASLRALVRVHEAVKDDPDKEYALLHLIHSGFLAAKETGATWARAMDHILDGFERNAAAGE